MASWSPKSWSIYGECERCGVGAGARCIARVGASGVTRGEPVAKPHPYRTQVAPVRLGRPVDPEIKARRLTAWKTLALRGVPVAEIAHQLGISRPTLDRFIVRARKRNHPLAVYHPNR